jgi:phosphoribosylformylglycinamidine synthase
MDAVGRFAAEGGPVLGICNGFQILCEAGLLPGVLRPNHSLEFVCANTTVQVERTSTPLTSRCTEGQRLVIPVKHGEGAWFADDDLYAELVELDQIVFRYESDVNGALHGVAGVCNREGNIVGLMPHPEHAVDPLLGPDDGAFVIASLVDAARDRTLAAV